MESPFGRNYRTAPTTSPRTSLASPNLQMVGWGVGMDVYEVGDKLLRSYTSTPVFLADSVTVLSGHYRPASWTKTLTLSLELLPADFAATTAVIVNGAQAPFRREASDTITFSLLPPHGQATGTTFALLRS